MLEVEVLLFEVVVALVVDMLVVEGALVAEAFMHEIPEQV